MIVLIVIDGRFKNIHFVITHFIVNAIDVSGKVSLFPWQRTRIDFHMNAKLVFLLEFDS